MHRQPGYIEFGGYVFLYIGRCYSPLVLYTRCTRGRGLDCPCSCTLIPWTGFGGAVLGAVDTVLAPGGCHWLALALARSLHCGLMLIWVEAALGSPSNCPLPALQCTRRLQPCRCVCCTGETCLGIALLMCALGHDTSTDVYSPAPFGAPTPVQHNCNRH